MEMKIRAVLSEENLYNIDLYNGALFEEVFGKLGTYSMFSNVQNQLADIFKNKFNDKFGNDNSMISELTLLLDVNVDDINQINITNLNDLSVEEVILMINVCTSVGNQILKDYPLVKQIVKDEK